MGNKKTTTPQSFSVGAPRMVIMRSKSLHMITKNYTFDQLNDPTAPVVNSSLDIAMELSKQLGRNIRQGNNFRVVGWGAHLNCAGATDADTGMAAVVGLTYAPVTEYSVKAWNQMFKKWQKQKQLSGKVGQYVRYDDFEVSFAPTYQSSRTSTVYAGGLNDTNSEYINIYGAASSGVHTSLQDMYDSYNPIPLPSTDEFGVSVKSPKFNYYFPAARTLLSTATLSAHATWARWDEVNPTPGVADYQADPLNVHYFGAQASGDMVMLPADNHIDTLCGVFQLQAYALPPDVDTGDLPPGSENDWTLTITLLVEGWSPLVISPKPARKMLGTRRTTGGKTRGRRRR
jgi:hypothetical protein